MAIFDEEFGEIKVRKTKLARAVKISVGVDGTLQASIPYYSPEFAVKRLINHNRDDIREMFNMHARRNLYQNGQQIGKSHNLIFRNWQADNLKINVESQAIVVKIPHGDDPFSAKNQAEIRKVVAKILRKQARAYLPRRTQFIAEKHGFNYQKIRLSHASTRWGSCSSSGTISLNIALMNLPHHLIDYVIIHELCHTRQMNHSPLFWAEVEKYDPNYREHVRQMKSFSPNI